MAKERNNQKVLWADKEFVAELERIQAKRLLNGNPAKNLGQLTKEIRVCPSYNILKKELANFNLKKLLDIKLDKKRRFQ